MKGVNKIVLNLKKLSIFMKYFLVTARLKAVVLCVYESKNNYSNHTVIAFEH